MKKILTLLFLISLITGYSQDVKIEGIGKFKISKTTINIIDELSKEMKVDILKTNDDYEIYKKDQNSKKYIYQLIASQVDIIHNIPYSKFCPKTVVYKISGYEIATFYLNKIYLTFYNDTLVKFNCDYVDKLDDALVLKYGEPKRTNTEKEINCTFIHTGAKITYKEIDIHHIWKNDNIKAIVHFWKYYTSDCEEHFISNFSVENELKTRFISDCEYNIKTQKEKESKEELKKQTDSL